MANARLDAVINGLTHLTPIAGAVPNWSLAARMRRHAVPAISFAVIDEGEVALTAAFGVMSAGTDTPVRADTLFQAASMSKPVTAMAVLRAVEQGRLDLDRDVNDYLSAWQVPESPFAQDAPVTLRGILSHTAGLSGWGFEGYAVDQPRPDTIGVLRGVPPANSPPVVLERPPGTAQRYSGGGTTIAQLVLETCYEAPFDQILAREVLQPIGMHDSTFAQPLPLERAANAASGHDYAGRPMNGRWHVFPEQAAAGLWTTAGDYARWLIALQRAWNGRSDQILSPAAARAMGTLPAASEVFGLGPKIIGRGRARRFQHGGSNVGYKCGSNAFLDGSRGAVVLTNADGGTQLAEEVFVAIARAFDWPDYLRPARTPLTLTAADRARYAGVYQLGPDAPFAQVEIADERDALVYRMGGMPGGPIHAASATSFFSTGSLFDIEFGFGGSGAAETVSVRDDGRVILFGTRIRGSAADAGGGS